MTEDFTPQGVLFNDLFDRPLHVQFDQPDSSSDGGAFLLAAADQALGLTERLALCQRDNRKPGFILHSYLEMLRQRVFGLCCGFEDCYDAARLKANTTQTFSAGIPTLSVIERVTAPLIAVFIPTGSSTITSLTIRIYSNGIGFLHTELQFESSST